MINVRKTSATGFGTIFVADKKANGIAKIEPTNVPRNAIQIVSNNKYATPLLDISNKSVVSGEKIPLIIFLEISAPFSGILLNSIVVPDQATSVTRIKTTINFTIQVRGAF